jgi:hypothetical protein
MHTKKLCDRLFNDAASRLARTLWFCDNMVLRQWAIRRFFALRNTGEFSSLFEYTTCAVVYDFSFEKTI